MQRLPDASIDMVLCDMPYGTTCNKWDVVLPLEDLWRQYERVIKDNGAIVLFSQQPFTAVLVNSNPRLFRYEWIWQKTMATGFMNAQKMPLKAHENILVIYKHLPTYNPQKWQSTPYKKTKARKKSTNYGEMYGTESVSLDGSRYPLDVLKFNNCNGKNRKHPTQKPVDLLSYLIKTYTNKGEIVLDNCMGSGSTAVACVNTGRNYIGFETDAHYCEIAEERINLVSKQKKS